MQIKELGYNENGKKEKKKERKRSFSERVSPDFGEVRIINIIMHGSSVSCRA